MAGYIPRNGAQKKKNILVQREVELAGAINRTEDTIKIEKKAERVRVAQLAVIKALLHELERAKEIKDELRKNRLSNLKEKAKYWKSIEFDEIVQNYSAPGIELKEIGRKKW